MIRAYLIVVFRTFVPMQSVVAEGEKLKDHPAPLDYH